MPFDTSSSVNETTIDFSARALGSELREARRGVRLSQKGLALAASIDLATVQGLERGVGTVRSLLAVFDALGLRFADQPSNVALGQWIADARKATGNSQAAVALIIGVSKPTIIQIEHGRGNIRSLLQMMSFLRLSPTVAPQADALHDARLILGDCLEVMTTMADGSVDLIVTSPPYNLGNANGGGLKARGKSGVWGSATIGNGYENHHDNMPHNEYVRWQQAALREMWRLIPDDGAIFYNHKHRIFKGTQISASELIPPELNIRQEIIWDRGNGYNFGKSYFTPSHELIILIAKPKFKLRKYAVDRDVWRIGADRGNPHPAPFPVALASKCIDATNAKVVFDPFMGSGSAGVAAIRLGRKFIGIDHSEKYVAMARTRIAAAIPRAPVDVAPKTYPVSGSRLILGDCLEVLPSIPDGTVDAVIADLPYGMSKLEWDRPIPLDALWREFRRVLRPTGAVVLTCQTALKIDPLSASKIDPSGLSSRAGGEARSGQLAQRVAAG